MSLLDKFNSSEKLIERDDIKEFSFSVDYLYAFSAKERAADSSVNLSRLGKKVGQYIDESIRSILAPKLDVIVVKTPKRALESEALPDILENFRKKCGPELSALKKLFRGKISLEVMLSPHEIVLSCKNLTLKEGFSDHIIEDTFKRVAHKKNISVRKLRRGQTHYYDLSVFYRNDTTKVKSIESSNSKKAKRRAPTRSAPIYNGNA